jgi:uncharacterized tellurite resistance protein B-like protein
MAGPSIDDRMKETKLTSTTTTPPTTTSAASDAAATLLAIVVSANGQVDPREVAELERLGAYKRLGISRQDFLRRAEAALEEIGRPLSRTQWLRPGDRSRMLALQQEVHDRALRLLVCRLSAAVITADGRVTGGERQVYESLLGQWALTESMVVDAIRNDPWH